MPRVISLNDRIGNTLKVFFGKRLVMNIIRRFFVMFLIFAAFENRRYIVACGCEDKILRYKKISIRKNPAVGKQEFNAIVSTKIQEEKPIIIKPQVIYPKEVTNKKFVGAEKCKLCHSVEYRRWQKTKHAQAYKDMEEHYEEKKAENVKNNIDQADCESCHTTGYGYNYGFRKNGFQEKLVNVQCEVCHGPGEEHIKNYKQNKMVFGENPMPESLCRSCHCEEISPGFKYDEYLRKINCIIVQETTKGNL